MTEKSEGSKVSLSREKTNNSAHYTLKVPNFFTLPEYDDTPFDMRSPSFEFANATWCFELESRAKQITETAECIKKFIIYMVRLNFEIPEQRLLYSVILLNADGGRYQSFGDVDDFTENDSRIYMMSLDNCKLSYDTRDTLTLVIQLCNLSTEVDAIQVPVSSDRDAEVLAKDLKKLFVNGKHHDLTLKVAEREFRVHKDILMARSQVFEAMLSHDMTEKNEDFIDVPDCDSPAMEQFLIYLYSGKVETLNQDIALGLYYLADKYNIIPLKEKCKEFIQNSLSVPGICDVIQLALNHNDSDLLECATEYFLDHTNEILPTVGWMSFLNSNSVAANELFIKASKKWNCTKY